MSLELKQSLRMGLGLVMTPQLQQAIKLLQLNRLELQELITQEMIENPILEESADSPETDESSDERDLDADVLDLATPVASTAADLRLSSDPEGEQRQDELLDQRPVESMPFDLPGLDEGPTDREMEPLERPDEFNWEAYLDETHAGSGSSSTVGDHPEEQPSFENTLTRATTLVDHLAWQLSMVQLREEELALGELILGNLTPDGYLNVPLAEVAAEVGVELENAEEILKIIQHFDPVGSGSRSLGECLLVQAKLWSPRDVLVETILTHHLADLERRNYPAIASVTHRTVEEIKRATHLIRELEPKPGRAFQGGETQYIVPDIYITLVANEFVVSLNEEGLPRLKISPYYRTILAAARSESTRLTRDYVQEKLRSALWLIRSLHNRQKTIHRVTEAIVKRQREFFTRGVQFLKPMILKEIAQDVGLHESTVSRVTTNKFVHTPAGIFELKFFFNAGIPATDGGELVASQAVRDKIRHLIAQENPRAPLSDQRIVQLLQTDNIDIARRTVAKYRDQLNIQPSGKRKQFA